MVRPESAKKKRSSVSLWKKGKNGLLHLQPPEGKGASSEKNKKRKKKMGEFCIRRRGKDARKTKDLFRNGEKKKP